MALETKLVQRLSQNLLMTPQLQQAIKLLQLGRLDYIEAIENELLDNPLLEELFEGPDNDHELLRDKNLPEIVEDLGVDIQSTIQESTVTDWEHYLDNFHDSGGRSNDPESRNSFEENFSFSRTLDEDLLEQLRSLDITEIESQLIPIFIGNLDHRGFLQISLEEISEQTSVELNKVLQFHQIILSLEPTGVGARNLRECLLVQLDRIGKAESLEAKIVTNHLDLLEKHRYAELAKALHVSLDEIRQAIKGLHGLDPFPARQYLEEAVRYIIPDVYIQKLGDDYQILLNDEGIPKLQINSGYSNLLRQQKDKPTKEYYNEMFKSANWLLRSIEQRQRTIFRVTESIIKFQKDFFDNGISYLKPLVLKEVADDIMMHESTVSRVTTNKYAQTPQGIFELKFFFTPGLRTDIGQISSSVVKERIKKLVESESSVDPISDQRIVEHLQSEKIEIARRTVAKYRDLLGIPPSSQRKRLF
jgi:RNA polymerase sigma-54 factor